MSAVFPAATHRFLFDNTMNLNAGANSYLAAGWTKMQTTSANENAYPFSFRHTDSSYAAFMRIISASANTATARFQVRANSVISETIATLGAIPTEVWCFYAHLFSPNAGGVMRNVGWVNDTKFIGTPTVVGPPPNNFTRFFVGFDAQVATSAIPFRVAQVSLHQVADEAEADTLAAQLFAGFADTATVGTLIRHFALDSGLVGPTGTLQSTATGAVVTFDTADNPVPGPHPGASVPDAVIAASII